VGMPGGRWERYPDHPPNRATNQVAQAKEVGG
jgi:hypothetical protein